MLGGSLISESWEWNLVQGILIALVAIFSTMEAKSSALISKSLLAWPLFILLLSGANFFQALRHAGILREIFVGVLFLCGIQALLVNLRRLAPWPSGTIWLGLALAGLGLEFHSGFVRHLIGFIWMGVGLTKVIRERSPVLEGGIPCWIQLLYVQAILIASYR